MIAVADPPSHHFGPTAIGLVAVIVVLIVLTGFLALSETALTRMSKVKAASLVDEGRRGAGNLLGLVVVQVVHAE